MCFGVIRSILHEVRLAHIERLQHLVVFRACHKSLGFIRHTDNGHFCADRDINAFRLTVPDIFAAVAEAGEAHPFNIHIYGAGGRHDTCLITWHLIFKRLTFFQLYDVEVVERHDAVLGINNRLVRIVIRRNVHWGCLY